MFLLGDYFGKIMEDSGVADVEIIHCKDGHFNLSAVKNIWMPYWFVAATTVVILVIGLAISIILFSFGLRL